MQARTGGKVGWMLDMAIELVYRTSNVSKVTFGISQSKLVCNSLPYFTPGIISSDLYL